MVSRVMFAAAAGLTLLALGSSARAEDYRLCTPSTGEGCEAGEVCSYRESIDPEHGVCEPAPGDHLWLCDSTDPDACRACYRCRAVGEDSPVGTCEPSREEGCPGDEEEPPPCEPPPFGEDDVGLDPCAEQSGDGDDSSDTDDVQPADERGRRHEPGAGCHVAGAAASAPLVLALGALFVAFGRRRRRAP